MRKKVVHIIHEGSGGGGATLALNYFPRYLERFETVAITGCRGDLAERLRARGVPTYALWLDRPVPCVLSIPVMVGVLRRERPDIVVVHGQWGGTAGAVAAWLARVPSVIYYTHMPSFYTDWDLYRILRNRVAEAVTCGLASQVICPSRSNRYQYLLRELVDEKKCLVIPNGLDAQAIAPVEDKTELRRALGLAVGEPVVVSVGRLSDQKRVDWLVQAWARVEAEHPTARLYIVGDGEERVALEKLADALGLRRCAFLGRQTEAHRFFQAADLGVITTMFEAQPYALLEAMACSCPMVGTRADGVKDTIDDGVNGRLVRVADPVKLAEAILELLADPAGRQEMGRKAREKVLAEYQIEDIVRRQLDRL
jgi:glycosyltransferase involved in cell wall biosynthesis